MKGLVWTLVVLLLLIAGVAVYLGLFSGNLVKDGIETYAPDYLGADVDVDAVDLSLTEGSGTLWGLRVGNPQGFGSGDAMRLGEIKVVLDTDKISVELVVLKQVKIDGAEIAAVAKGKATNFQQLMDNVTAAAGLEETDTQSDSETRFIVERFDFTNAKASVSSDVLGDLSLTIPDIHLKGVGRESGGVVAAELAKQVMEPIYQQVSKAMVAQGLNLDIEGLASGLKEKVGEKLGGLKRLIGQ